MRGWKKTVTDGIVLLLAAYLQAAAFVRCARVALDAPVEDATTEATRPAVPAADTESGAEWILRQNPFESHSARPAVRCAGLGASIVTRFGDDGFSLATVRKGETTRLVRRGSRFAGMTVASIDEREVILTDGAQSCRVPLGRPTTLASETIDPPAVTASRAVRDEVLARPSRLLTGASVVPEHVDGIVSGFRVERLARGALLETLGIRAGDRIRSVNGLVIHRPEQALSAWVSLSKAESFRIDVERDGRAIELRVRID